MPGFVSEVVMTTLHAPSKLTLAKEARPVGAARTVAELPPVSQITRVGVASAELVIATAPRATAKIFNFFIVFVLSAAVFTTV
jgi:hypothetical protein